MQNLQCLLLACARACYNNAQTEMGLCSSVVLSFWHSDIFLSSESTFAFGATKRDMMDILDLKQQ